MVCALIAVVCHVIVCQELFGSCICENKTTLSLSHSFCMGYLCLTLLLFQYQCPSVHIIDISKKKDPPQADLPLQCYHAPITLNSK